MDSGGNTDAAFCLWEENGRTDVCADRYQLIW